MTRFADLDVAGMTLEQRRVHDAIVAGPRGVVEGPLKVWLSSPGLAATAQQLGAFCRFGTSLSPRLSELAILITGEFWRAGFEWAMHAPIALAADISPAVVEAIRSGATPDFARSDEKAVYDFCVAVHRQHGVDAQTYARAVAELGDTGVVELVGILGYYTLISMTINVFEVPLPAGAPDPFPNRVEEIDRC